MGAVTGLALAAHAWALPPAGVAANAGDLTNVRGGAIDPVTAGGPFDAMGVTIRDWIPLADFPDSQTRGSDIWGYTSPSGRQYALVMFRKGTAFVEVTDPDNATIVGYVSGGGVDQVWRDAKTYQHYAYVVSDGAGVGLQIIDMSDIDNGNVTLVTNTDLGSSFSTAHNIAINEESGYAYLVGGNLASGGIKAVDLSDPVNPVLVGVWSGNYVHDVQVVNYTEGKYAGREIAFAFGGSGGFWIVDVTDKGAMFALPGSPLEYTNLAYCHQGWITADRKHVFISDELDEFFGNVATTTTYIANIEDLEAPTIVNTFDTGLPSSDHNLFTRGDYLYCANYTTGLFIWDVSNLAAPQLVGTFDSHPETDGVDSSFPGAWAPYVGFPGSIVLLNDRERGLFVLDAAEVVGGSPVPAVSTWGMAALVLVLLVGGTVLYGRRQAVAIGVSHETPRRG